MRKGALVVVSGFSGSGKGTVLEQLRKVHPEYAMSVSATSRERRADEQEGVDYFFKTKLQFEDMIKKDSFIEYAEYCGNYYGTLKSYVQGLRESGKDVILEIEVQGAHRVKQLYPESIMIFITPPSAEELKRRLVNRGSEDVQSIERRMRRAGEESLLMDLYEYIVINETGKVEECAETLHQLIQGKHDKKRFIARMQSELR